MTHAAVPQEIRILHVITTFSQGGATENTLFSVEGLKSLGYDVRILAGPPNRSEGDLFDRAKENDIPIRILPELVRNIHPWKDLVALVRMIGIFREERITIVHTHSSKAGILGRVAALAARTPIVVHTIHGLPFHESQGMVLFTLFQWAERLCSLFTDKLITVTDTITQKAIAAHIGKREQFLTVRSGFLIRDFSRSAPKGKRLRKELGIGKDELVVGKIARFSPLKGHRYLIDAIPEIIAKVPGVKFLLVGGGELEHELRELVRQKGVAQHVLFSGMLPVEHMPEVISMMDVVVHTSVLEGLARVLPQALALEKPVVSFDIDGAHEVITHGVTGYLVSPGDTGLLAAFIVELLKNRRRAMQFGCAGRKIVVDRWDVKTMVQKIDGEYRELMEKKLGIRANV